MSRINSHYLRKLHLEISIMKVSTVNVRAVCVLVYAFLVHVWVCDWAHLMHLYFLPFFLPSTYLSFSLSSPLTILLSLFLSSSLPLQEVDHPNIIKLREVFFGSRTVYLVMELCQGGELFDEITHNAQRGLGEVRMCVCVCVVCVCVCVCLSYTSCVIIYYPSSFLPLLSSFCLSPHFNSLSFSSSLFLSPCISSHLLSSHDRHMLRSSCAICLALYGTCTNKALPTAT